MPIPQKLLKKGVTDLVRISDARMSGTSYGTVLLHTSPEAAVGGPLALVHFRYSFFFWSSKNLFFLLTTGTKRRLDWGRCERQTSTPSRTRWKTAGTKKTLEARPAKGSLSLSLSHHTQPLTLLSSQQPAKSVERGYTALYTKHVLQADQGADLDFLVGASGDYIPRENH